MWNAYAAVSALIFAIVSVMHVVRLINRWPFVIGPYDISMNVSRVALVVAGRNLGLHAITPRAHSLSLMRSLEKEYGSLPVTGPQ